MAAARHEQHVGRHAPDLDEAVVGPRNDVLVSQVASHEVDRVRVPAAGAHVRQLAAVLLAADQRVRTA